MTAISEALVRLRGKRRGLAHKARHDGHSDAHHETGQHDEHPRRRSHGHHAHGSEHSAESGETGTHLSRSHGGSPAIVRTVEALGKAETPLGVSEIAERIGVDQPRASRLVQQGVARGLFAREADPDDARRSRVALTDRGREFATNLQTRQRESLGVALDGFSEAERNELARLLTKLADSWPA